MKRRAFLSSLIALPLACVGLKTLAPAPSGLVPMKGFLGDRPDLRWLRNEILRFSKGKTSSEIGSATMYLNAARYDRCEAQLLPIQRFHRTDIAPSEPHLLWTGVTVRRTNLHPNDGELFVIYTRK